MVGAALALGVILLFDLRAFKYDRHAGQGFAALQVVEGASTTYLISWVQRRTDQGMQGRAMSVAMLSSVGLQPLALTMAGALASRYLGVLFWGSAAAIELTALAASLSRSVRRL